MLLLVRDDRPSVVRGGGMVLSDRPEGDGDNQLLLLVVVAAAVPPCPPLLTLLPTILRHSKSSLKEYSPHRVADEHLSNVVVLLLLLVCVLRHPPPP